MNQEGKKVNDFLLFFTQVKDNTSFGLFSGLYLIKEKRFKDRISFPSKEKRRPRNEEFKFFGVLWIFLSIKRKRAV